VEVVVGKTLQLINRVAVILVVSAVVVGLVGGIVYGLYRITQYSREMYGLVFLAAAGLCLAYFLYRALRLGMLKRILLKTARALIVLLLVCGVVAAFALAGGLVIRRPVAGSTAAAAVLFAAVYLLPRLKVSFLFQRYLT
jgi:hypothetical protein